MFSHLPANLNKISSDKLVDFDKLSRLLTCQSRHISIILLDIPLGHIIWDFYMFY